MALKLTDLKTDVHNDWCPGCGDFGILSAVQMALAEMNIEPAQARARLGHRVLGQDAALRQDLRRPHPPRQVPPVRHGIKLSNPNLEVIACGGDGDGMGIGAGHFVNSGRRNVDMTYIVYDNGVYGLTKGQAAPTLKLGMKTKSLRCPNINTGDQPADARPRLRLHLRRQGIRLRRQAPEGDNQEGGPAQGVRVPRRPAALPHLQRHPDQGVLAGRGPPGRSPAGRCRAPTSSRTTDTTAWCKTDDRARWRRRSSRP